MEFIGLLVVFFSISFLYSSIGHGGASGYIAFLTLVGYQITIIRPAALLLNVLVASVAFYHFRKAGFFQWRLFAKFGWVAIPMAYLGSKIILDLTVYRQIIGFCLLFVIFRMIGVGNKKETGSKREVPLTASLVIGGSLGFLSGMIGIGGGILLSPLLVLFRWATLKESAAVAALFIVVNSLAGLLGLAVEGIKWSPDWLYWGAVTFLGSQAGAFWGSKKASMGLLSGLLVFILFLASVKLVFI
jgi:uncharacterized protein